MVGWLSYGNKRFAYLDTEMRCLIPQLNEVMLSLVPLIDADTTDAFNGYMVRRNMIWQGSRPDLIYPLCAQLLAL